MGVRYWMASAAMPLALVTAITGTGWAQQATVVPAEAPTQAGKPAIRTQDDLPRFLYRLPDGFPTATALLAADDATFNAWAAQVGADADATLNGYQIDDPATRRRLLATRMAVELLTGRDREALASVLAIRALEQKPDLKLTSGIRDEAILRARIEHGTSEGPAFQASFAQRYRAALDALPFAEVATALKESKGSTEIQSPSLLAGWVANELDPQAERAGGLSLSAADDLLFARTFNRVLWPVREPSIAALRSVIAANTVAKPDIWAAREVTITEADQATPVVVAVWDSGVDTALFKDQLYVPAAPPARGPGNGHGLSFDMDSKPVDGVLMPLTAEQQAVYPSVVADFQGFSDLQQAIDSPAAEALRAKLSSMPATETAAYIERLDVFGDYIHGTHVAGILARGNPAARIAVIRNTFDPRPVPAPPTDATVAEQVALYRDVSDWLKANRVRVVNMSWIDTPGGYESALEKNGIGKDQAERKSMARRFFERSRAAFAELLAANPGTLFVSAAGNSDSDNGFEEGYPSSLVAPNLIIASATDQAGEETSFTSNGSNVAVSANGYQVVSYVPGGQQLAESGTSMASPNVANLAAKLIAVKPDLTPEQVIALIKAGATPSADGRRRNIDGKASLALLRAGRL